MRLARQIDAEIETIADRIVALLEAGWSRVRVVTDHGWLLLPGGLPKVDLPHYLTATRWARCATVKGESATGIPTYAWHWNPLVRIASPPGIGAFVADTEYAHGGVSAGMRSAGCDFGARRRTDAGRDQEHPLARHALPRAGGNERGGCALTSALIGSNQQPASLPRRRTFPPKAKRAWLSPTTRTRAQRQRLSCWIKTDRRWTTSRRP